MAKIVKPFFYFLMVFMGFMGAIGGVGYCLYYGEYHIALGVAALAYMAFPVWNEYRKKLMDGEY